MTDSNSTGSVIDVDLHRSSNRMKCIFYKIKYGNKSNVNGLPKEICSRLCLIKNSIIDFFPYLHRTCNLKNLPLIEIIKPIE